MAHKRPGFETEDINGRSLTFVGNVGVSNTNIPSSTTNGRIEGFAIQIPSSAVSARRLSFSVDAGVTFWELSPGEFFIWDNLKSNGSDAAIQQIIIKGNNATTPYQIAMNFRGT